MPCFTACIHRRLVPRFRTQSQTQVGSIHRLNIRRTTKPFKPIKIPYAPFIGAACGKQQLAEKAPLAICTLRPLALLPFCPCVATIAANIAGYADPQASGHIVHFFVAEPFARQGAGSAWMNRLCSKCINTACRSCLAHASLAAAGLLSRAERFALCACKPPKHQRHAFARCADAYTCAQATLHRLPLQGLPPQAAPLAKRSVALSN